MMIHSDGHHRRRHPRHRIEGCHACPVFVRFHLLLATGQYEVVVPRVRWSARDYDLHPGGVVHFHGRVPNQVLRNVECAGTVRGGSHRGGRYL